MLITIWLKYQQNLKKNLKRIEPLKIVARRNFSQVEVHRAYISGIENGRRNPTLATIQEIS